jgi:hypothetical protein
MNEKEYIYGAMSIYMDIINIFVYLLRLIGDDRDKLTAGIRRITHLARIPSFNLSS